MTLRPYGKEGGGGREGKEEGVRVMREKSKERIRRIWDKREIGVKMG